MKFLIHVVDLAAASVVSQATC